MCAGELRTILVIVISFSAARVDPGGYLKTEYRDSVVGLIDILGVSEGLSDPEKARRYSEAVAAVLGPMISDKGEYCFVLPHVEEARKIEVLLSPVPSRMSFFSDSIVVSAPVDAADERKTCSAILACLEAIKGLQRSLLLLGLRSRGGLSRGGLIHSGELLVGDGLVRAYDLERKEAKTPRTVIDPSLIIDLISMAKEHFPIYRNRVAHAIRQDNDGAYFVDYLAFCPTNGFCGLEREFERILERAEADLQARPDAPWAPKFQWLTAYVAASALDCQSETVRPHEHADIEFAAPYPRTGETLREFFNSEEELVKRLGVEAAKPLHRDENYWLWPLGWRTVMTDRVRTILEAELVRELTAGHVLKSRAAAVLGRFEQSDDVLFRLEDGSVAEVHLTWEDESQPDWPRTTIHPSFQAWATAWRANRKLGRRS
ncbi:hypothetical protein D3C80_680140 [compost metagenome]